MLIKYTDTIIRYYNQTINHGDLYGWDDNNKFFIYRRNHRYNVQADSTSGLVLHRTNNSGQLYAHYESSDFIMILQREIAKHPFNENVRRRENMANIISRGDLDALGMRTVTPSHDKGKSAYGYMTNPHAIPEYHRVSNRKDHKVSTLDVTNPLPKRAISPAKCAHNKCDCPTYSIGMNVKAAAEPTHTKFNSGDAAENDSTTRIASKPAFCIRMALENRDLMGLCYKCPYSNKCDYHRNINDREPLQSIKE